ncbi:MAG: MalY/PatB family protein [Peptoniphilaceae bacterium]|jgi:cystathionine beta-lyase
MAYDFTTLRDGFAQGSYKWNAMKEQMPEVPSGIVPLSVADMEFVLAEEIRQGIGDALQTTIIGYNTPTQGYYDAVIRWMKEQHDWTITKESIIPYQGVVPMIARGVRAFSQEGDGVLILSPVYHPFRRVIEEAGRKTVVSSLLEEDGVYTIDFPDLDKKAAEAKILLFCSPHNPVGRVWDVEELKKVAEIAKKHNLLVISDEIHHDLSLTKTHTVFSKVADDVKHVVTTAPTKTFNLAGAKVSNLIVEDPALRETFLLEEPLTPSVLGLIACEQAYDKGGAWLLALKEQIKENEAAFRAILRQKAPNLRVSPLEGTYLLWVDLRALGQEKEELERMVKEAYLFPNFGDLFGEEGLGFIRINLAAPKQVIVEAAERLADRIDKRACCW